MSYFNSAIKSCLFVTLASLAGLSMASGLPYRSGIEIDYEVLEGDTPQSIVQDLLRPDISWSHIAQLNQLSNRAAIGEGTVLRVPVTWLRHGGKFARVEASSGDVKIDGKNAIRGSVVSEDGQIATGKTGVVVILLPDGTEMTIAPSSTVRIDRLRQYFDGDSVEARIRLERGEIESFTPRRKDGSDADKRDIKIQTPKATAAVRGTQFRVADTDGLSASGVITGKVNWTDLAGLSKSDLPAGYGAAFSNAGKPSGTEELLPAPTLIAPENVLTQASTTVPFEPIPGAVAYEVKIAANTSFTDVLEQFTTTENVIRVNSTRDGNHFVAVRGLSPTGVEGYDGIGKVSFLARPFAPKLQSPANGFNPGTNRTSLQWDSSPDSNGYRIQLASDANFSEILVDEKLDATRFEYQPSNLRRPVRRYWRVASLDNWVTGPFTTTRSFVLNVPGPKPTAIRQDNDNIVVSWNSPEGAKDFLLTVTPIGSNSGVQYPVSADQPGAILTNFKPGSYNLQVVARYTDQLTSNPSLPTQIDIPSYDSDLTGELGAHEN